MPKGKGYGKRRKGFKGKSKIRKTMRPNRSSGKKIYHVGGYQA